MLKNAYFLAKIGADTAENEQHFAEILPIGSRVAAPSGSLADPVGRAPEVRRGAATAAQPRRTSKALLHLKKTNKKNCCKKVYVCGTPSAEGKKGNTKKKVPGWRMALAVHG